MYRNRASWEPYTLTIPADAKPSNTSKVTCVKGSSDGAGFSVEADGIGCFLPILADDQPEPKLGDTIEIFGEFGRFVDGIRLNGSVIFYRDAEYSEQHARRQSENAQAALRRRNEAFLARRDEALQTLPTITTAPGKEDAWQEFIKHNSRDPYSFGVVQFAAKWARAVEASWLVDDRDPSPEAFQRASKWAMQGDLDGITGYMYGAAVHILSQVWIHGEALRRWHNLETQLGTEGEKANASGGVLNPALFSLGAG